MSDIVDRIRKILRLSRSNHAAEAETAMCLAARLAAAHGIELNSVDPDHETETVTHKESRAWSILPVEARYASILTGKFFRVKTFTRTGLDSVHRVVFVGLRSDVEIAYYVFNFLLGNFRRCWNKRSNRRLRNRKAFLHGMFIGLWSRLVEELGERDIQNNSASLVPVFGDYIERHFGALVSRPIPKMKNTTTAAAFAGYADGRDTKIRPAIKPEQLKIT